MKIILALSLPLLGGSFMMTSIAPQQDENFGRPRIRELGVAPGVLPAGPLNAITDVAGVRIGHVTLIEGDDIRTGVTAIVPHDGNLFQEKLIAGVYVGNGFGKAAGFLQVQELGTLETPIVLTNTLSVGCAVTAVVRWTLDQPGNEEVQSLNPVVGETNDGFLNDIRAMRVTEDDVIRAIETATHGPVAEGSVGAGTGTRCFGFKGGIGTSSRRLPDSLGGYTVGALVQSNFGGVLTIDGQRVGEAFREYSFRDAIERDPGRDRESSEAQSESDGSCLVVIATDAPLSPRQLERLARRAMLGLARTGSFMSNGSGDFAIAFSTAQRIPHHADGPTMTIEQLRDDSISSLFLATVEATEEAVYNSLTRATTITGFRGRTVKAIPIGRLRELLKNDAPLRRGERGEE